MGWGPNAHLPNIYVQRILASCLSCRCWKKCWNIRTVQMNGVPRFNQQKCWMKQIKETILPLLQVCISMSSGYGLMVSNTGYMLRYFCQRYKCFKKFEFQSLFCWNCVPNAIFLWRLWILERGLGPCKEIRRVTSVWWIGPTVLRKVHFLHRKGQLCLLYSRLDRDIELWLLERTLWKVFFWEKRKNSKPKFQLSRLDRFHKPDLSSPFKFYFSAYFLKFLLYSFWRSGRDQMMVLFQWFERACLKGEGETKSSRRDRFIKSCSSNSGFYPFRGLAVVKTTKRHHLKPSLNGVDHSTDI